ncbi:MAG TPA: hypothetical protein VIL01_05275 [Thermomicrobiales bacterium]
MTESGAAETYARREAEFASLFSAESRRWERIGDLRLVAFFAAAALAIWASRDRNVVLFALAAVLIVAFFVLVGIHRRLGRERARIGTLRDLNAEALLRLHRAWSKLPVPPDSAESDHPYAADLDLFGRASLFQLLNTANTPMGQERLRAWLLAPADHEIVRARQLAVAELAPMLDWRQEFAARGRLGPGTAIEIEPFLRWAEGDSWLERRGFLVWLARLSAVGFVATGALSLAGVLGAPVWLAFLGVNLAIMLATSGEVHPRILAAAGQHAVLVQYAGLLRQIESASFTSSHLQSLQGRLSAGNRSAGAEVARLRRLTSWVVPRGSIAWFPLQLLLAWDIHVLDRLESWQRDAGKNVRAWLDAIGEVEALAALAALKYDEPDWAFPEIDSSADSFEARGLGHPLLPRTVRVVNDVVVGPPGTFLLVTGSNMSGKSTLLRSIGVNAVLALAGAPVCARSLRMPPVEVWTSARIQDSLEQGVSFFMAELLRLKQIVEAARTRRPDDPRLLYLLDEILQGTNTAERQIAARRIIRMLVESDAIGAVSTHDLALVDDPDLEGLARTVHFRETVEDGPEGPRMTFDYRLRPGLATSTNALRLLELVGLGEAETGNDGIAATGSEGRRPAAAN